MRIAVDERRIVDDRLIDLDDFSIKRTIDVRSRLDGLDRRGRVALGEAGTRFRQFHEDKIAELASGMLRDADGRDVAIDLQPFVFLGEFQHTQVLLISVCRFV